MTLNELSPGERGLIIRVGGQGPLRLRLLDMGLISKTAFTMVKRAPLGDPIVLTLRGYTLTIREEDAMQIEVIKQ
ncbi:MAG TPA: ferrous iron transport protein A [Clostridiales bacterium]|jgi:Fe2+ transport system protein FeoA|nr:ferrous iron transport protein A [Clostridiales bacterium]